MSSEPEALPVPPPGFRWWHEDDVPALETAWSDPEILRWNPVPALDAGRWISGVAARWERRLALDLVIDRDGDVVGEVGLSGFASEPARAEIGVWVAEAHRGAGVAAASVRAVAAWARDALGLELVWARTHIDNRAGRATMAAAGFVPVGVHGADEVWRTPR